MAGSSPAMTPLLKFADAHYYVGMTKDQIDAILDRVHSWPKARQEDAARVLLAMEAQDSSTYVLSDEERADVEAALAEAARGEFATDEEVAAVLGHKA
jgi:predicted transcriptional regulator